MKTKEVSTVAEVLVGALKASSVPLFVVCDVGATNCRIGIVHRFGADVSITFVKRQARSVSELLSVLSQFESECPPSVLSRIAASSIAVPGPVADHSYAVIANYGGSNTNDRTLRISRFPSKLFPAGRTRMLNDLESAAYGIAGLNAIGDMKNLFHQMWERSDSGASSANREPSGNLRQGHAVVLAPGTGLGVALLAYDPDTRLFNIVPLEFGHTNVVATGFHDFLKKYANEMNRGDYPPEYDDLASGRGLERAYRWATGDERSLNAAEVSSLAIKGDAQALAAFDMYYRFLMMLVSQLSMGFVPDCVVLCGDNVVRHDFFLKDPNVVSNLRTQQRTHSMERLEFMSRVRLLRQTKEVNLNVVGCAYSCAMMAKRDRAPSKL